MKFLVRMLFVIAGLIFAASLLVMMLILLLVWSIRAIWGKLTGKPFVPFAFAVNPRAGFDQVFRRAERGSEARPQSRKLDDVTDVEPKR